MSPIDCALQLLNHWDDAAELPGSSLVRVDRRDAIRALGIVYSDRVEAGDFPALPDSVDPAELIAYVDDILAAAINREALHAALDRGEEVIGADLDDKWKRFLHAFPLPSMDGVLQARSRGWTEGLLP